MPSLSIIIPVFREGENINGFLEHLFQLDRDDTAEVIVVDGNGGTTLKEIDQRFHPLTRSTVSSRGRGRQMNAGAEMAMAPYLLFLHADSRLPQDALGKVVETLKRDGVVAGAFGLEIDSPKSLLRFIARMATLRSRWSRIPYGDQAVFISRASFETLGGYREWPLMEDVELMRRIRSKGWRIVLLREKVKVSPRRWEKEGLVYCTLRNWALLFLYGIGIPPRALSSLYPPITRK